jgi:hypothetical protein
MQRLRPPSAFGLSMPVKRDGFSLTCGSPKAWHHAGARGFESTHWLCADCGGGQEVETIA